jgi:hypothetical protein
MATCRSCDAPMVWAETVATETKPGRKIPLNARVVSGKLEVLTAEGGNLRYTGQTSGDGTKLVRYVPNGHGNLTTHFATCPNRAQHRKGGGKR